MLSARTCFTSVRVSSKGAPARAGDLVYARSHLLGRWDPRDIDVEISLQDRGGTEQRVTLRTSLPGRPPLVAVAENPDITRAICEAKRELIRQLEHQKSARDPMSRRRRGSATIRH